MGATADAEVEKAKAWAKAHEQPPGAVFGIVGAGLENMNGYYAAIGDQNGHKTFRKVDKAGNSLHRPDVVWGSLCDTWCMCDNSGDTAYLWSKRDPETKMPPTDGWKAKDGPNPVPTIRFL